MIGAPLALALALAGAPPSALGHEPSASATVSEASWATSDLAGATASQAAMLRALEKISARKLSPEEIRAIIRAARPAREPPAVAIVVPVGFFTMVGVVVGLVLVFRSRRERVLHETIRLAIERGADIPTELLLPPQDSRRSDVRRGLVLLCGGLGFTVMLSLVAAEERAWAVGLFPMMIGSGYLAYAWLERRGLG